MSVAPSVWLLSDGKAGHETPLTGVAEALGARFELRRVGSRAVFAALAPFGPIDPRHRGGKGRSIMRTRLRLRMRLRIHVGRPRERDGDHDHDHCLGFEQSS